MNVNSHGGFNYLQDHNIRMGMKDEIKFVNILSIWRDMRSSDMLELFWDEWPFTFSLLIGFSKVVIKLKKLNLYKTNEYYFGQ